MGATASADIFLFEDFRLDRRGGVLFRRDQEGAFALLAIGRRALDVLGVLVENAGDLISRDEILNAAWPGSVVEDGNLSVQISILRNVLDNGRPEGSLIQTVPGGGYRFVGQVTRPEPNWPAGADALASPAPASLQAADMRQAVSRGPRGRFARVVAVFVMALCLAGLASLLVWTSAYRWFDKAAPPVPRLSIVVLPFNNLSNDPEQQYFVDGVTDDLTTDLSRWSDSFVISRNTAFTYKGKPLDAKQIGRELGVRYVLEGSVRRSDNQVRVNVQLIDGETGSHLWAERFDRDIGALFDLQNEITGRIGNSLSTQLATIEADRPRERPEALDYVFRARAVMNSRGPGRETYAEAIALYERALSLDSGSISAQGLLAQVLMGRVLEAMTDTRAADIQRAERLIQQVLAGSPSDPGAHYARGQMLRAQGHCDEARLEFEMVLAINHNSAGALMHSGRCMISAGLLDEAILRIGQAIRLSPHDSFVGVWYSQLGLAYLLQSRPDEAILWLEKSRSTSPHRPFVHAWLAAAYGLTGKSENAGAELAEARSLSIAFDAEYSSIAHLRAGRNFMPEKGRALYEATFDKGLRNAGIPEE